MSEFIYDQKFSNIVYDVNGIAFHEFENCTFTNCNFSACSFLSVIFIDCYFIDCSFKDAQLGHVSLRTCDFTTCNFTRVNFAMIDQMIYEFSFKDCNMEFAQFYGLKLKNQVFSNCSLISADFMEADLRMALFDNCNLHRAVFTKANAEKTDFYTSYNYDIDPTSTKINKAIFSRDGLEGLLTKFQLVLK